MGSKGKSSEELEMEKIAQFQKEVAEQRKLNEESLKLVISGAGILTQLRVQAESGILTQLRVQAELFFICSS